MSSVPSNERTRWKSLESVAIVSWSGSAILGGVMSDKHGYSYSFAISAFVQLLGAWALAPLDFMVVDVPEDQVTTNDVQEPLLSTQNDEHNRY